MGEHRSKEILKQTQRIAKRDKASSIKMAAVQLLIFAIGSMVLSSVSVYGGSVNAQRNPESVSYSQKKVSNLQERKTSPSSAVVASDLAHSATAPFNSYQPSGGFSNFQQNQEPRIYHSIIDRTVASSQLASPVQASTTTAAGDLHTAAGHHHGHAHHGKYYQYAEVPKKKTWKFGYKRGNHKHTISRHEYGKNGKHPHFKTKVKWHDKKSKGKGIHLWDYNHYDKKHYHHGR